jgi:hypothetical protein
MASLPQIDWAGRPPRIVSPHCGVCKAKSASLLGSSLVSATPHTASSTGNRGRIRLLRAIPFPASRPRVGRSIPAPSSCAGHCRCGHGPKYLVPMLPQWQHLPGWHWPAPSTTARVVPQSRPDARPPASHKNGNVPCVSLSTSKTNPSGSTACEQTARRSGRRPRGVPWLQRLLSPRAL